MMRSALATFAGGPDRAEAALTAAGVSPSSRGESLAVADFARISDALAAGRAAAGDSA
jgi:16S rRNA (adenine1518-N6/adenine1519-N6)-dimethyltransferase